MDRNELKEEHIRLAGSYIAFFREESEKIYKADVRRSLTALIRSLQELRDTEYIFESGEKELIKVYDRYLPYLKSIVSDYMKMQEAGNYEAINKVSDQMIHAFEVFGDAMDQVRRILPQDEIDQANAEAAARKMKEALDRRDGLK